MNSAQWSCDVMLSGALYFVPAGSTIEVRKEQPIDYLLATIDPEAVRRLFEDCGKQSRVPAMTFNLVDDAISGLARQLRHALLLKDADLPQIASNFIREAVRLVFDCHDGQKTSGKYRLSPRQIRCALEFINENLGSPISVERLAQESTGLSGFHFAHAFTAMLGYSPHQYILDRRIAQAHQLLASTSMSLADISYQVGFSSQAHMTTTFCKRFGATPGKLRQRAA